jgi:transcriptional regulator with XRE-family HTH domain
MTTIEDWKDWIFGNNIDWVGFIEIVLKKGDFSLEELARQLKMSLRTLQYIRSGKTHNPLPGTRRALKNFAISLGFKEEDFPKEKKKIETGNRLK